MLDRRLIIAKPTKNGYKLTFGDTNEPIENVDSNELSETLEKYREEGYECQIV